MSNGISESQMTMALKNRYAPPAWALIPQVRDSTGYGASRTADALAMSLWPSRGIELHGFEIKIARNDWLRELRDPKKAEEICTFCDRWWVAAAPDIVQPGELPPAWGLLVLHRTRLICRTEAPKQQAEPLTREFLAALLRRAQEVVVPKAEIEDRIEAAYKDGLARGTKSAERRIEAAEHEATQYRERIEEFERASGVQIGRWDNAEKIGEAVKFVLNGGLVSARAQLVELRNQAAAVRNLIDNGLATVPESAAGGRTL